MSGRAIPLFDFRDAKLILLLARFQKLLVEEILIGLKFQQADYVLNELWLNLLINSPFDGQCWARVDFKQPWSQILVNHHIEAEELKAAIKVRNLRS